MPRDAPSARRVALAVVIGLHGVVLLMWQAPRQRPAALAALRTTITVALLRDELPTVPEAAPQVPSRPPAPATRLARKAPGALHIPALPAADAPAADAPPMAASIDPAVDTPAAAAPSTEPSLLDAAATRRAIADAARRPSHAAQAGIDNHEHAMQSPDARLGAEIAKGAIGDCAKGEFAGGGMGLLSLPFLAAAVLSEKCRR